MKFKVFVARPSIAHGIAPLLKQVEEFINGSETLDAVSLGIEYVEDQNAVVMSLGYVERAGAAPVRLTVWDLGQPGPEPDDVAVAFEKAVGDRPFICHEFMIDHVGCFTLLLLERA